MLLAAVSRTTNSLTGGIGSRSNIEPGKAHLEILAYVTPAGDWSNHPCAQRYDQSCDAFAHTYLSQPHQYTVISADGRGSVVQAAPVTLSECYDYTGSATFASGSVADTAIAASDPNIFTTGSSAAQLAPLEQEQLRKALARLVPGKLDSLDALRLYAVLLEGRRFIVVQRSYEDYASDKRYDTGMNHLKFIFAVGTFDGSHFTLLHWKGDIEDDDERVLGTIHLKSGRDFLITSSSDPEGQNFRIYGIRGGKLGLVFEGGGSSC
ncbi:MAG TPA: hypothetical protein VGJ21_21420 [Terracidiphilus sp.]